MPQASPLFWVIALLALWFVILVCSLSLAQQSDKKLAQKYTVNSLADVKEYEFKW